MCEDAACGTPERLSPEMEARLDEHLERLARKKGMTKDEFVLAMNTLPYTPPRESFLARARSWFESFSLNIQLLKPGL